MAMKLIEFNRRGFICAFNRKMTPGEKEALIGEERVILRAIEKLDAKYFVVMKRISEKYMLIAPVFSSRRKDCKKIRINNKEFWVNFMTFYMVPEKIFEAVPGKHLDFSYRTIMDIYTSHNNVLKEKWRSENEQAFWIRSFAVWQEREREMSGIITWSIYTRFRSIYSR